MHLWGKVGEHRPKVWVHPVCTLLVESVGYRSRAASLAK